MKVVIVEDEIFIARRLEKLLLKIVPEMQILITLQSVTDSVDWFASNDMPDLIFMDIHLADDISFSIFNSVDISCPIIFTTAYDEYALKAFEVNSIDYLIKPIGEKELQRSLNKYNNLTVKPDNLALLRQIAFSMQSENNIYKSSILVPVKDKLIPLKTKDIAYIYFEDRNSIIVNFNNSKHVVNSSLDELIKQLNPSEFYRANRQYIITKSAVQDVTIWFGNRLSVNLIIPISERIIVSRSNVQELKHWLTT